MDDPPITVDLPHATPEPPPSKPSWRELVDNRWIVLATLFLVTAACGLPLLWVSHGFSRTSKIVLTVVTILYTIFILWLFWIFMAYMWENFYAPYL